MAINMYTQKFPQEPVSSSDTQGVSPEEIMRHLFQEYRVGKDNTQLLSDALANATPEQLEIEVTRVCLRSYLISAKTEIRYDRHFIRNVKPPKLWYMLKFHGRLRLPN